LSLGVRAQIGLESVGVDDGDIGLDGVEWRAGLGNVLGDVPSTPRENLVDCWDAILGRLNLDKVDGLGYGVESKVSVGNRGGAKEEDDAPLADEELPGGRKSSRRDERKG
jgi:hypothetical protein